MAKFYQIELKSILTWNNFNRLQMDLPDKIKLMDKEMVHSMLYQPGWHALKSNDKDKLEYVVKEHIDRISTEVTRERLDNTGYLGQMRKLNMENQFVREWGTARLVFGHTLEGHTYKIYLENIIKPGLEEPAYVLKVRHEDENNAVDEHALKLRKMMVSLGAAIIHPSQFEEKLRLFFINKH